MLGPGWGWGLCGAPLGEPGWQELPPPPVLLCEDRTGILASLRSPGPSFLLCSCPAGFSRLGDFVLQPTANMGRGQGPWQPQAGTTVTRAGVRVELAWHVGPSPLPALLGIADGGWLGGEWAVQPRTCS